MKTRLLQYPLALAAALPLSAQTELLLEGSIDAITRVGPSALVTILGQQVLVPADTMLTTPTATIDLDQLLDQRPYPGRMQPGHIGCSATVHGKVLAGGTRLIADRLFVEPAENVVLGVVTGLAGSLLFVNGMPTVLSTDSRLPSRPAINAFGFSIVPSTVALGAEVALEGWFAGGSFHAFGMEVSGAARLEMPLPQTSVLRAVVRERTPNPQVGDEYDVRGAVTMAHAPSSVMTQLIAVFRLDHGVPTQLGIAIATRDTQFPDFATWRLQGTTPPTMQPVLGVAPAIVRAVNTSAGANLAAAERATTAP